MIKRLMRLSVILLCGIVYAETTPVSTPASTPAHDESSKDSENLEISVQNVHQIDLDTTQVDGSGNWFAKRIWYTKSQNLFSEIRTMVTALGDLRMQFANEVSEVDHKIDSFFERVNFAQGQLDEKFKDLAARLEAQQKMVGDLSPQERQLQATIKQEQATIDQIERDMKSIGEVDEKINQTKMQASKTIDECREFETKSWDAFQSIGKELDDKKARTIYYQMHNYKQNIEQKTTYLKTTLLPYLHNVLVAKIDMNIAKINAATEMLKVKGLDVEKIMNKEAEEDKARLEQHEREARELAVKQAVDLEQEKTKVKLQKIEEESKKALKLADEKSFNNVMHRYYEQTIGKVVAFVHQGYLGTALDAIGTVFSAFFSWYSYPVATYVSHKIVGGKIYMQHKVDDVISYFGGKSVQIKKEDKDKKDTEKHEVKEDSVPAATEQIAEKQETEPAVLTDQDAESQPTTLTSPTTTTLDDQPTATSPVTPSTPTKESTPAITSPVTTTTPAEHNEVVVQSMSEKTDTAVDKQSASRNLYTVLRAFLNLITTIFASVYACISQFLMMIFHFAAYIQS